MRVLASCLLVISAVTVTDAGHGCTTCPSNACSQNEAHIGFCKDEVYVSEAYQCSYSGSRQTSSRTYYDCGWWDTCSRDVTYYVSVTRYRTCYRSRLNCQRRCCSGFQSSGGNCLPVCSGGCHNGGVCIDPETCECPSNWQGQYCNVAICTGGCLNGGECVAPETCNCSIGWTGQNCESDIDECTEGIIGCHQHCTNTVPGYNCSCDTGYTLNEDGHLCDDIDECASNNGGCAHLCHNTIGNFYCSCRPGYTLQDDNFTCVAQPCPTLYAPFHGGMSCTGEQVTDETCYFTCDPGYELLGSAERFCQPTNAWTGQHTSCRILHCPVLNGNDDTFIVYPCDTAFNSSCMLQCTPGHYYRDPNTNFITCIAGPVHETVIWTDRPMCEEIQPCQPNPCLHGGQCNELDDGTFFCSCDETGYKGGICDIGIVNIFPQRVPVLQVQESFNITVSAKPDRELISDLTVASGWGIAIVPPQLLFDSTTTSHQVTITALDEVVTYISVVLSGLDHRQYETPADINIVVQSENSSPEYANNRNLNQGILEPSCCAHPELNYHCLSNDYIVQIISTCKAEENSASVTVPGISFVAGNGIDLPLSLDNVNVDHSYTVERAASSNRMCGKCDELSSQSYFESFANLSCGSSNSGTSHCYCYRLSSADISDMLSYEGLAKTYLQRLSPLFPDWLTIAPLQSERIHGHDSYHTFLVSADKIGDELFCSHFLKDSMGRELHSLLIYRGNLELQITNATSRGHNANGHFCVAVDMCACHESPIHISLPEGLRPENDPFFQQWEEHGWEPYFEGVAISLSTPLPVIEKYRNDLWNGKNDMTVHLDLPQISLKGHLKGRWQVNEDVINLILNGKFDLHVDSVEEVLSMGLDQNIQVVLPESSTLTITTTESSTLRLTAVDKGYMSLNSSTDGCTRMMMMKLVHSYSEDENSLLSQVLAIQPPATERQQEYSCQIDVALGLSSTGAHVTGLALRSFCHVITFKELTFNGLTTILAVGRSGSPAFCGADYTPSANIELHLWAESSSDLEMNAFITLVSDNEKPVVIATLDPASSSYFATILQAQISVLGSKFTAPVQIDTQELRFIAYANIFQQAPTTLVGTAPVANSWDEMELRLQGNVAKHSDLHDRIELQTRRLLTDLASRANDRIDLAEVSLNSIRHQRILVEGYYNDAAAVLQAVESRCAQFDSQIGNTEAAIAQLELNIEASGASAELLQSLNEVCDLEPCGDVCAPGMTCSLCSVPVETQVTRQCPATCTRTKQVRRFTGYEYFTDYTTEVYCGGGGAWVTCVPLLVEPTAFTAGLCFFGFFLFGSRCSSYRVPIQGRRDKFENVLVEEHYACTKPCIKISTHYIMQECCIMDECASTVPDTSCVKENAVCHLARKQLLREMSSIPGSPAYQIQLLDDYHSNLTALHAQKAQCEVEEQLARHMSDQLQRTFNRLSTSVDLGERHIAEIQAIHMAGQALNNLINYFYDINSIFNVTAIDFDISASVTTGFSSVVPLKVSYIIPYLNRPEEVVTLFEFDYFESSIQTSSEEMSRAVQDILTEGASTKRRRRLVPSEDLEREEYWQAQCTNLYEMAEVVEYILETLHASRNTHLASLHNATIVQNMLAEVSTNLSDSSNISFIFNSTLFDGMELTDIDISDIAKQAMDTDAVEAVNTTLNEVSSVTGELVAMTAESAFLQWQIEISSGLNATVSVYGHRCAGFLDCIITITEVIKNTLEIPQIPEANRLLELLPEAEQELVKLAFRIDLSLEEAIASVDKIMYIVNMALDLDYWCAAVPSVQLDHQYGVILQANDTFELECNATSPWSLIYEWQKDNATLPGANKRKLDISSLQLSDAGEYRCIASNHIGSVTSVSLGLTVVTPPVVATHPASFSTYPQSGDQVVLHCDVSGSPPPVISWYITPPGSQEAMLLPNATSTELRYSHPEPHHEGWYHCVAANQEGVQQSRQAYVHILNSSVVQFAVPAVVKFSEAGMERQRQAATSVLNTGIDPLLLTTLEEDNSELTETLTQLIQEHVDLDGVTLLKASTNDPASPSSISFLVATEVVPIDPGHTTPLVELFENFTMAKEQLRMAVEELSLFLQVLNYTSLGVTLEETEYSGVDLTTAIWRCPLGQGLNTTNYLFCVECLPGEYPAPTTDLMGGSVLYAYPSCTKCPTGHYQSEAGQAYCKPCPSGHYQPSTGQTSCEPCPSGYYQVQIGQDYCLQCPEESITKGSGATSCIVQQPRLSIVTDPTPTLNLTFQQLQLPALVLESGTTVNGTCTLLGVPQCELFGAFSIVQVAANGALLEGEERNRPIENGVPEVIPVFSPGVAFCRAVVDDQNITSQMILFTIIPVIVNLTASPSTGVPQESSLNLTCAAVGGPTLNVTWTTPIEPRVGSVISIDNVTADVAGEYRCEVMSEAGTTNDSISIRVGVRVKVQPMNLFVSVNDTLRLTCNVSGSEPISYQWLKNGELLQDDGRVSGSNASVLVVDPVEGNDFGGYECNASNDVDQVQSGVAMVAVAPNGTVVVTPATETLSVNDSVTFTCMSEGGPSNVFQWGLNGVDLPGESGTLLSITGVDADDGGTYRCTVSNAAGVDRDMATLFVNPILLEEPVDTNISLFEDGMLICRARGFPVPEVLWYQNGTRLDVAALGNVNVTAVMMSRITASTLAITNATFDNSGRYFCSVTSSDPNVTSVNSSEVDVIVRHTPEQPVNVTVTEVTPFSVALAWVEPHDNNAPINDYIITIGSVGTSSTVVQANASVEAFNVTDLRPFVNYTFTVAAENDLGEGLASTPVFQHTLEFFPSAPLNLTVSAIGRRSVNVTWSPPANPNGVLLFYQLEYSIVGQSSMTLDVPAESLAASIVELTPAQVYQVTVRANTSVGFGRSSEPVRATTGMDNPSAPVNLTATNVTGSANSVTISWAPPLEPNGIILTYEVTVEGSSTPRNRRQAAVTVFGRTTQNVSNTTTSVIIANLTSYSENTVTVVAYTSAGPGEQAMVMFRTGEDTPLAPRNLTLEVTSSQSINVSWTRPLFFRGQLSQYKIFFASSNHSGMNITSSALADQNSTTFHLTGLEINTVYEVSVQAVTGAGPGENVTDSVRTAEDAPLPVMALISTESGSDIRITWGPPGLERGDYFYRLSVLFQSTFSNVPPDRIEKGLFEHEFARTGTDDMPFSSFLLINTSDDNRQQVAASNRLLHRIRSSASYDISLAGVNQNLRVSSVSTLSTLTTLPTPATPVTSLAAVAVSNNTNFTLQVSWDLPRYPNGEIQHYVLQYRQLESDMGPVSTERSAMNGTEVVLGLSFVIHGLPPFTFFEVTVFANNSLPGFPTNLTVRTNASVPAKAPALPTSGWYADYQCLTIPLLIPSEDTGILIRYNVIVFGPTDEGSPEEERRLDLANTAINGGSSIVRSVRNFTSLNDTREAPTPFQLCPVSDDSQYFVFFRLEFESDGSTALVTTSEVMLLKTPPIALPVGLSVVSVAILAGVAVAVIIVAVAVAVAVFLVRRRRNSQRYNPSDNVTVTNDHEMETFK